MVYICICIQYILQNQQQLLRKYVLIVLTKWYIGTRVRFVYIYMCVCKVRCRRDECSIKYSKSRAVQYDTIHHIKYNKIMKYSVRNVLFDIAMSSTCRTCIQRWQKLLILLSVFLSLSLHLSHFGNLNILIVI